MKKTILIVFMVVTIATPCFAQEVEPEGIFTIGGTQWKILPGLRILPLPWIWTRGTDIGFWDGKVYEQSTNPKESFYVDMLAASIFMYVGGGGPFKVIAFGIMQPAGIGMMMECWIVYPPYSFTGIFPSYSLGIMPLIKTDDNWLPPDFFHSISPNRGYQGATLKDAYDVHLYASNTFFQDNPFVEISFDPPDGLTVSNIDVITNTEIEFDLEIAIDAPIGFRDVIVTYAYGNRVVTGIDAFEVMEKPL
jgi:hypothetical protein